MMKDSFILKCWEVTVSGYGPVTFYTTNRGKALADAWRSTAFHGTSFGDFLKMARCRKGTPPDRFGDKIAVGGRPAHFVRHNGHCVQFVRPGSDTVVYSHPNDVEPAEYRKPVVQERAA